MARGITPRAALRSLIGAAVFVVALTATFRAAAPDASPTRALWVTRTVFPPPESISQMVGAAEASGFNTLLVQVRARGDAYFDSSLEPRAAERASRPSFVPLDTSDNEAR